MREWLLLLAAVAGAVAAIASAVAAWSSVRAANRQERATYESQLYNKQVDTISALMRSALDTPQQIDDMYEHFLAIRPDGQNLEAQVLDQNKREVEVLSRFLEKAQSAWLIVPGEVQVTLVSLFRYYAGLVE
jgi:hypothetical protein